MKQSKLMTISVNDQTMQDLNYLVKKTGMKKSEIIRQLLRQCVLNDTLLEIIWTQAAAEAAKKLEKYMPERFTSHNALYVTHQEKIRDKFKKKPRKGKKPNEATVDQDDTENLPNEEEKIKYPCEGPDGSICKDWNDYMESFYRFLGDCENGKRI